MIGLDGYDTYQSSSDDDDSDIPALTPPVVPPPSRHATAYLALEGFLAPFLRDNDLDEHVPALNGTPLDVIFASMREAENEYLTLFLGWRTCVFLSDINAVYMDLLASLPACMALVLAIHAENEQAVLASKEYYVQLRDNAIRIGCVGSFVLLTRLCPERIFTGSQPTYFIQALDRAVMAAYMADSRSPAKLLLVAYDYVCYDVADLLVRDRTLEVSDLYTHLAVVSSWKFVVSLACEIMERGPIQGKTLAYSHRASPAEIFKSAATASKRDYHRPLPQVLAAALLLRKEASPRPLEHQQTELTAAVLECANPRVLGRVIPAAEYLVLLTVLVDGGIRFHVRYAKQAESGQVRLGDSRRGLVRVLDPFTLFRERMFAGHWTREATLSVVDYMQRHLASV